jgi:hypothetical protein
LARILAVRILRIQAAKNFRKPINVSNIPLDEAGYFKAAGKLKAFILLDLCLPVFSGEDTKGFRFHIKEKLL